MRSIVTRGQEAHADYKAGRISRKEWHRRDPFGAPWVESLEGTDKDPEYKAIKHKLDAEYRTDADKQQLVGMKADLARDRGFSWRSHRLWGRCRKELEADGNAVLLKAMDDAERDPRRTLA